MASSPPVGERGKAKQAELVSIRSMLDRVTFPEEKGVAVECQVKNLPDAGRELSFWERSTLRILKLVRFLARGLRKVISDPAVLPRKITTVMESRLGLSSRSPALSNTTASARPQSTHPPLRLKPGELVRVKSPNEIQATLNDDGQCEGMSYMASVMNKYCGGTYTVRKPMHQFFDERRQRLCKIRNVVILEGVYCEPPKDSDKAYAGCDRTCFLFWKEAWLERAANQEGAL